MSNTDFEEELDLKETISDNRLLGVLRLIKGYEWKYISASLSQGVSALSKTASYLLLKYFIDNYIGGTGESVSIYLIASGFILLALSQGGFTFLAGKFAAETAEGSVKRLRDYLFDHIQRLSYYYHNHSDTGELIQRVTSDVDAIRRFFADQLISFGRITFIFIVNFTALLFINVKLALISVAVIPIIVIVSLFFFRRVSKAYQEFQEQEAIVSTTLQENLTGVRVVKAFARQEFEISKFTQENWKNFQKGKFLTTMHSFFWPSSDILCGIQVVVGYFVAAMMVINNQLTIGDYLAYAGMLMWIIFPMRNLGRLIVQMSTGLVSYSRVRDIIREDKEPIDEGLIPQDKPVQGAFKFNNVSFEYEPGQKILKDISFTCQPGQVVALLGGTGSGKTTLVNLIPRFFEYSSGSITLDGVELNTYSRKFLRDHIGIVEQEPFLFSRSIKDNIMFGVSHTVSDEEVYEAAKSAAIHDVILDVLGGYDTIVGERGTTLSGGQKQRVAIARALLRDPAILILDDSTSSVDTETESEIRSALNQLMKNRTTFIIAHRIQSIMTADLILVMKDGEIVQAGKHNDLVEQDGIYKHVYQTQAMIEDELQKELSHDN